MNIIPQIDTYPRVVSFCQTPAGKVALLWAFAGALVLNGVGPWAALTVIAAAITFLPHHRRLMLSLGALYMLLFFHNWLDMGSARRIALAEGQRTDWVFTLAAGVLICGMFGGMAVFIRYVRARRLSFVSRRPVLVLVCSYFAMLAAAGTLPLHGYPRVLLWVFISVLAPYLWFFAYALTDAPAKAAEGLAVQFGYNRPIWMTPFPSFVPIAKGAAYLRKIEATTPKEFSRVQLKAVKLLMWVFVLKCVLRLFSITVHGGSTSPFNGVFTLGNLPNLGLPTFESVFEQSAAGLRVALPVAWGCAAANFIEAVLGMTIAGNLAVACCRMAGFNALRNTYRPFEAQTLAEFWNRYYYYFKELLVEFFFFPFYTRYFKRHPRLRIFAATVSAATVGNLLYHFGRDYSYVAEVGFWKAVSGFQIHAVYALFLGAAIGISQLRNRSKKPHTALPRRVLASASVILFYALVQTFNPEDRVYSLSVHLTFIWNMFHL